MEAKENSNILKHAFLSWIIFSTFFCIAAYNKAFHVDEYFSWVYAERCTFTEILLLREFGIGHPPLYHLIQKTVQQIPFSYSFPYVRLANYLLGSLFVTIFVNVFLKYRNIPVFCYAASISATMLNAFIFSRMWGLLCLSSLLLLWSGEKYRKKKESRYLGVFLGISALGLLSDYNFILLSPYILLVIFSHRPFFLKTLFPLFLLSLIITWITTTYLSVEPNENNIALLFYKLFSDIPKVSFELGKIFFNYWFVEIFLFAFLLLGLSYFVIDRLINHEKDQIFYGCSASIFFLLISLHLLIINNLIRVRHVAFILTGLMVFLFWRIKTAHIYREESCENRLFLSIFGGLLILLSVSPVFWRGLVDSRFLQLFFPFVLLIVYLRVRRKTLYLISSLFSFSGLLYILSTGVSDMYSPPSTTESNVIFQNVYSYSTQYLSSKKENVIRPYIIDTSGFEKHCKLCGINSYSTEVIASEKAWFIGNHDWDHKKYIPEGFELIGKNVNLTWLDKLQFKYLTPIYPRRFAAFEYQKSKTSLR